MPLFRLQRPLSGRGHARLAPGHQQGQPLSYQVDALRGLLLGTHAHLALDYGVLALAAALGILSASSLLGRLAR